MKSIEYRRARKGEGRRIAELILMAWPVEDMIATVPGMTYDDMWSAVASLVEQEENMYSHEHSIVAVSVSDNGVAVSEASGVSGEGSGDTVGNRAGEDDGEIVGVLCAYDGADYARYKVAALKAMGMDQDSPYAKVIESEAGEFYLDSVGVDPDYRGHGIASRLFQEQIRFAISLGYRRIGLIVDVEKTKAEALYSHLGFRVVGYRDFMGHPMKHMVYEVIE